LADLICTSFSGYRYRSIQAKLTHASSSTHTKPDNKHQEKTYLTQREHSPIDIAEDASPLAVATHVVKQQHNAAGEDFSHHVGTYTTLLKRVHLASKKSNHNRAFKQLYTYVYASSIASMHRRLTIGVEAFDFFDMIEPWKPDEEQAFCEVFDLPAHLEAKPTSLQMDVLKFYFGTREPPQSVGSARDEPVYSVCGRARIHEMLIAFSLSARNGLQALRTATHPSENLSSDDMDKMAEVARLVEQVRATVNNLSFFLQAFDRDKLGTKSVLFSHLERIWKVRKIG
jgi:hypothetical protein